MELKEWREGYEIVVSESDLMEMLGCSGTRKAIEKMKDTASKDGKIVKRILMPALMGRKLFGVPVVEVSPVGNE